MKNVGEIKCQTKKLRRIPLLENLTHTGEFFKNFACKFSALYFLKKKASVQWSVDPVNQWGRYNPDGWMEVGPEYPPLQIGARNLHFMCSLQNSQNILLNYGNISPAIEKANLDY